MTTLLRTLVAAAIAVCLSPAAAQTTVGAGTTIVTPVIAQTGSYISEVTLYNPNGVDLAANVAFYEALNSSTPGAKTCAAVNVPAGRALQFALASQCTLTAASHFGLLVVTDTAAPPGNPFYGYTRVQNPQGIGFSIEGFPVGNFNDKVSHATGLKRQAAAPIYQTNCFVASLDKTVHWELRLFNATTGAQIGGLVGGTLGPYAQYRMLDVFGTNGVHAPDGDYFNVRAEFKSINDPPDGAKLIGFCTVQDSTSFGADFRIAKNPG